MADDSSLLEAVMTAVSFAGVPVLETEATGSKSGRTGREVSRRQRVWRPGHYRGCCNRWRLRVLWWKLCVSNGIRCGCGRGKRAGWGLSGSGKGWWVDSIKVNARRIDVFIHGFKLRISINAVAQRWRRVGIIACMMCGRWLFHVVLA